jgi:ABC-type proline/glycine betaine transport system substrate-binding protein
MIADTMARYQNGQPILYYTWTPYWVSGALVPGKDVEWLDVPYTSLPDGETGEHRVRRQEPGLCGGQHVHPGHDKTSWPPIRPRRRS